MFKLSGYKFCFWLVFITSIWIIGSIELELLPLIPCHFSFLFVNKINKILLLLSYSIVAAYIFYYITSVLPTQFQIYKSKHILAKKVYSFLRKLEIIINQILYVYNIEETIENIEEKNLLCINGKVKIGLEAGYDIQTYCKKFLGKGERVTGFTQIPFKFPDDLLKELAQIPLEIKEIRETNPLFFVDSEFAEILASIETNKLRQYYQNNGLKMPLPFIYADSSHELFKLIVAYKKLKKLKYHIFFRNTYNKIDCYSKEDFIKKTNETTINWNSKIVPMLKKEEALKSVIILNTDIENSKIVAKELKYKTIEFSNMASLSFDYKCVIIICEGVPIRVLTEFCKENKEKRMIILLKSNLIFTTKAKVYENVKTDLRVYSIYYRSSQKILKYRLYSKYPTFRTIQRIDHIILNIIRGYINR